MRTLGSSDHFLLSLARGDDVLPAIVKACVAREAGHAWIQGIGAIEGITIGAYDLDRRTYLREDLDGGWEVLSLAGNFGWADGEPVLHPHVVLSDLDNRTRGGHLFAATVHVTLELIVHTAPERLERSMDDEVGLKLWNLPDEV